MTLGSRNDLDAATKRQSVPKDDDVCGRTPTEKRRVENDQTNNANETTTCQPKLGTGRESTADYRNPMMRIEWKCYLMLITMGVRVKEKPKGRGGGVPG